jgi:hypothetical protein
MGGQFFFLNELPYVSTKQLSGLLKVFSDSIMYWYMYRLDLVCCRRVVNKRPAVCRRLLRCVVQWFLLRA